MKGENDDIPDEDSFTGVSPLKRIIVLLAGSFMNFILAIVLFFILFCITGTDISTTIGQFPENSNAKMAGIEIGDKILKVNDTNISTWEDITKAISISSESVTVVVEKKNNTTATYKVETVYNGEDNSYKIGIIPKKSFKLLSAIKLSVSTLFVYINAILSVLGGLFKGKIGLEAFSGPIGATVVIGQYIPQGITYLMNIAASISISLGLFNLFPLPALDGSRVLFCLVEMIKGSPINREIEGKIHVIGFVALLAFGVFIAYKDIVRFF